MNRGCRVRGNWVQRNLLDQRLRDYRLLAVLYVHAHLREHVVTLRRHNVTSGGKVEAAGIIFRSTLAGHEAPLLTEDLDRAAIGDRGSIVLGDIAFAIDHKDALGR